MGQPLELGGSYLKTEEGNELHYYGGGSTAYDSTALACAGVPLAVRKGKTVGVWENGKVVEYMWHTDTSNTGLIKKTADVNLSNYQQKPEGLLSYTAMTRLTGQVRIDNAVWTLGGANHSTGNAYDIFNIAYIANNGRRIDLLIGDVNNQLTIVTGVESLEPPAFPAVPAGKIMIASIHVDGNTISSFRPYQTSAAIIGANNTFWGSNTFEGQVEIKQPLIVTSFAGKNASFERYGYATRVQLDVSGDITLGLYLATNSLIELNATAAGTITSLATGYVANINVLVNVGVANITIKNNANIKIPNGQDFILKPGYSARFIGNVGVARLVNDGFTGPLGDFAESVLSTIASGITAVAGSPVATDSIRTVLSKFRYQAENFALLVRASALTGVDTSLTGTPTAADSFIQFAGRVINFIGNISQLVRGTALTGLNKVNTPVTADDTVLSGIGKLQGQVDVYGAISRDFSISYQYPTTIWKDYFRKSEVVTDVTLDGVSVFSYSINNGLSYETPTLPLTVSTQFTIPAGTVVRWRVAFANSVTVAMINIKLK